MPKSSLALVLHAKWEKALSASIVYLTLDACPPRYPYPISIGRVVHTYANRFETWCKTGDGEWFICGREVDTLAAAKRKVEKACSVKRLLK